MNNLYAYSDRELKHINNALPKAITNLKFLIAPIDDEELVLVSAYLLGGVIQLRREILRREESKRDIEGRMDKIFGSEPGDAA